MSIINILLMYKNKTFHDMEWLWKLQKLLYIAMIHINWHFKKNIANSTHLYTKEEYFFKLQARFILDSIPRMMLDYNQQNLFSFFFLNLSYFKPIICPNIFNGLAEEHVKS